MEVLTSSEGIGIADLEAAAPNVECNGVSSVGLQPYRVGSRLGCRINDRKCTL